MAVIKYQTLNIGELQHLLPCDLLRNNVRLIEKLNKRFINAKYGKNFYETCISERLFPKIANIHIYVYLQKRTILHFVHLILDPMSRIYKPVETALISLSSK